jgi:DNA-binding response OmpR family regulator
VNTGQHEARRPLVLVVDDDEGERLLTEVSLTKAGCRVVQASDGKEALEAFAAERPDIVLLDVNMPVMDGFHACRELRRLPGGEHVPVLMVTGHEDIQSINRAYEAVATDFMTKSSNWVIVAYRVRYMLRAALAIEEAEKRRESLVSAQRIARVGGWEWHADSDRFHLSDEVLGLLGLKTGEFATSREQFMNAIHPGDRERVRTAVAAALRGLRPYDLIHRVMLPDG